MKVTIRARAFADLENIYNWIAKNNPATARRVAKRISEAIELNLPSFPHIGRVGRRAGTRELIITGLPYVVVYEVDVNREVVIVQAIYHGAQNR